MEDKAVEEPRDYDDNDVDYFDDNEIQVIARMK